MSICYKLFGKPNTFDEFTDKVRRKKIDKINIRMFADDDPIGAGGPLHDYCGHVRLFADNIQLKLEKHRHIRLGDLHMTIVGKAEVDAKLHEDAISSAKKLSQLGFNVTIAGKPISRAKKKLEELNKYIVVKREEFGLTGTPLPNY